MCQSAATRGIANIEGRRLIEHRGPRQEQRSRRAGTFLRGDVTGDPAQHPSHRPNPLTPAQVLLLRGLRSAGPPLDRAWCHTLLQRLADAGGTICVAKQRIGCCRAFARQTLTVHVSGTSITVKLRDGDAHTVRRTTTTTVTTIKSRPPWTATIS